MKNPESNQTPAASASTQNVSFEKPRRIYDVICGTPSALDFLMRETRRLYASQRNRGIMFDGILNSGEDLFQTTIVRLSSCLQTCTSTGAAIAFAKRTAANLLRDSARKYANRSKVVTTLTPVEDDGDELLQLAREEFAAAATQQSAAATEEMRELLTKARAEFGPVDALNDAILAAIEDYIVFNIRMPSAKEIAQAFGAKQNTVTVREGKMRMRLRSLLTSECGYVVPKRPMSRTTRRRMRTPRLPVPTSTSDSRFRDAESGHRSENLELPRLKQKTGPQA